jgi:KDO2-lipid IV(A) lauroyltransferase
MSKRIKGFYRQVRRPLEWFLIGLGRVIIPPLSLASALRLSRFIADLSFLFDGHGKAIARANLRLMFGARMTPARERAIIRGSYRNMARVLVNIPWMSHDTYSRIMDQVAFAPGVLEIARTNQPSVMVSAHFGNWEILSQSCVANGIPVMSVAKEIGSPKISACLTRIRSTIGQEIVPAEGAFRPLWRALKDRKCVGLLVDQHTHVWEGGAWITLFGLSAGISLAPAALARKCGVPIVFIWSRPLKDGRYRIEYGQVFPPDSTTGDTERSQQLAAAFERVIRRHPSLWCLNYRRWKYFLPGDDPSRYPFYARAAKGVATKYPTEKPALQPQTLAGCR